MWAFTTPPHVDEDGPRRHLTHLIDDEDGHITPGCQRPPPHSRRPHCDDDDDTISPTSSTTANLPHVVDDGHLTRIDDDDVSHIDNA